MNLVLMISLTLVVASFVTWLLLRKSGSASSEMLIGRLQQMAETQNHLQAALAEQFRQQSKAIEERFDALSGRLREGLDLSSKESTVQLLALQERLAVIDSAQKNIGELSQQMVSLQDILSNKQARGAFGEIQLQDLIRSALPSELYEFQSTLSNGSRVDCLLKLHNPPGPIGIDAKFPLEHYEAIYLATNDLDRKSAEKAFAASVLKHINDISSKYIIDGETAESALMFIPSEAVYAQIHASHRAVIEEGYKKRVWIVSPSTLMATLHTIRAILRDVKMREQAHIIQKEVGILLGDVRRLDERVGQLQRHFEQSHEDLRQIRISTEKVTKRSENIENLQLEDAAPATIAPEIPKVSG